MNKQKNICNVVEDIAADMHSLSSLLNIIGDYADSKGDNDLVMSLYMLSQTAMSISNRTGEVFEKLRRAQYGEIGRENVADVLTKEKIQERIYSK